MQQSVGIGAGRLSEVREVGKGTKKWTKGGQIGPEWDQQQPLLPSKTMHPNVGLLGSL